MTDAKKALLLIDDMIAQINDIAAQRDAATASIRSLEREVTGTLAQVLASLELGTRLRQAGAHDIADQLLVEVQDFLRKFLHSATTPQSTEVH